MLCVAYQEAVLLKTTNEGMLIMKTGLFKEEYVAINGISQYFLHYPAACEETALILHGGPGQSEAHLAHAVSPYWDFCNLVYYDQRGAGKTQRKNKTAPKDITFEALIADLKQSIHHIKESYKTDRVILVGHSWGSILGTQYVLRYPEDVLCYIGHGQVVDMPRGEKLGFDKARGLAETAGAKKDIKKLDDLGDYPTGLSAESFAKVAMGLRKLQIKYGLTSNPRKMIRTTLKSPVFQARDVLALLSAIKTNRHLVDMLLTYSIFDTVEYRLPMYYILGESDWQTPSTLAAQYFETIKAPKKGLFWIKDAGHMTDLDNPSAFCESVREIMKEVLEVNTI